MGEIESLKKDILSLIEREGEVLSSILELSKAQYEAIEAQEFERLRDLTKERESLGREISLLGQEREELERGLANKTGIREKDEEFKNRWAEVMDLASQIREMDEKNREKMARRMDEISEKLASIKKARRLRETYFRKRGLSLYINRSVE
jgi:flagellar biosynthesis/type III secretory pathway chaperone